MRVNTEIDIVIGLGTIELSESLSIEEVEEFVREKVKEMTGGKINRTDIFKPGYSNNSYKVFIQIN